MIEQFLARIDVWLAQHRPNYYQALQAPASAAQLDELEQQLGHALPAVFRALYLWRNGQSPMVSDSFEENRMLMPLEEVIETKQMLDEMIDTDFDDPTYWRRGWIPFLSNGGGSYWCLDLAAEDGGHPGQVISFWKSDEDRPIEYKTMEEWLAHLAQSMEDGHYEVC